MQSFCFSSSGILLITADSSAPANQNYRIFTIKQQWPWKESLIFPLKFHKPELHLLQCSQHYLPSSYKTSDRALNNEWIFKPKVPKSFHRPPKTWSGCHRNTPLCWYPICLSQGFYSCTNIMTKKQVGEERVYSAYTSILLFITKEVRTGTQAGQEAGADAEAMEGCSLLACFPWLAQPALL